TAKFMDPTMGNAFTELVPSIFELYRDGDMEASFACLGMVAGRIDEVEPVAEIIARTVEEFGAVIGRLARDHGVATVTTGDGRTPAV
ncbi:MAG TPA: hypothetical protein VFZ17_07680, partial [Acidimicrobiia bacterium]|nr:hypothetical protein [Acidimicrobiia bacterium]